MVRVPGEAKAPEVLEFKFGRHGKELPSTIPWKVIPTNKLRFTSCGEEEIDLEYALKGDYAMIYVEEMVTETLRAQDCQVYFKGSDMDHGSPTYPIVRVGRNRVFIRNGKNIERRHIREATFVTPLAHSTSINCGIDRDPINFIQPARKNSPFASHATRLVNEVRLWLYNDASLRKSLTDLKMPERLAQSWREMDHLLAQYEEYSDVMTAATPRLVSKNFNTMVASTVDRLGPTLFSSPEQVQKEQVRSCTAALEENPSPWLYAPVDMVIIPLTAHTKPCVEIVCQDSGATEIVQHGWEQKTHTLVPSGAWFRLCTLESTQAAYDITSYVLSSCGDGKQDWCFAAFLVIQARGNGIENTCQLYQALQQAASNGAALMTIETLRACLDVCPQTFKAWASEIVAYATMGISVDDFSVARTMQGWVDKDDESLKEYQERQLHKLLKDLKADYAEDTVYVPATVAFASCTPEIEKNTSHYEFITLQIGDVSYQINQHAPAQKLSVLLQVSTARMYIIYQGNVRTVEHWCQSESESLLTIFQLWQDVGYSEDDDRRLELHLYDIVAVAVPSAEPIEFTESANLVDLSRDSDELSAARRALMSEQETMKRELTALEAARAELEQQQQELEQKMKELTKLTAFEEAYASHIKGTETTRTKIQVKRERERDDKNLRDGASKKLKKKKS